MDLWHHSRFSFLLGLIILSTLLYAVSADPPLIDLTLHSDGFDSIIGIVDADDGKDLLYVVEQGGLIKMVEISSGNVLPTQFLDVSDLLANCSSFEYCAERGLLGLVFHPNYATNGYFYINYTAKISGDLYTIISRFSRDENDPDFADPNSELILLSVFQPYDNHNAGDLKFGPNDGYLYIPLGDGGAANDPGNRSQDLTTLLGKLLRIDVDQTSSGLNYAIPPDNPFVTSSSALSEIWAYGLRNPWRIAFDRNNGNLFIADVGQNLWEELNFQPADSLGGENYGWRLMEGTHCFNPSTNCIGDDPLTMPITEYPHQDGACSITGGHMYRGPELELQGYYFYGDYCNGTMWAASVDHEDAWTTDIVLNSGLLITSFGEDFDGNLYLASYSSGEIYKLDYAGPPPCNNSPLLVPFNGNEIDCDFIGDNNGCRIELAKSHCPETCGTCAQYACVDSGVPFIFQDSVYTCNQLADAPEHIRDFGCAIIEIQTTCRGTCQVCA